MRHELIAMVFGVLALLGLAAVDQVGRRTPGPGALWVLARGEPGALLARLPPGLRILDTWADGRLLLLHAPALAEAHLPAGSTWLAWRASPAAFLLPACG